MTAVEVTWWSRRSRMRPGGPGRHLAVLLVVVLTGGCAPRSPAERYQNDPEALARGRGLFVGTCGAYCHSTRPDARDAPYLFDCRWLHGGSDEQIFHTISTGVPGTRMIGFGGKLPDGDEDIWKLVAFLKANRTPC